MFSNVLEVDCGHGLVIVGIDHVAHQSPLLSIRLVFEDLVTELVVTSTWRQNKSVFTCLLHFTSGMEASGYLLNVNFCFRTKV